MLNEDGLIILTGAASGRSVRQEIATVRACRRKCRTLLGFSLAAKVTNRFLGGLLRYDWPPNYSSNLSRGATQCKLSKFKLQAVQKF
jgi:hypothetical protein